MTMTHPGLPTRRVETIRFGRASAFTVGLFTPAEVLEVRAAVRDVPASLRHECSEVADNGLATIGEPLYRNRAHFDYYTSRARAENHLAYRHFRLVHERVAAFFERRYGLPAVYAEDLAVPGFHVFSFTAPGEYAGGGWHLDGMRHQVPFFAARPAEVSGVVNFTVPFEVPDGGTGLDLEDDAPGRAAGGGEAVTVPYLPGVMMFTESEHWHRIGASRCHEPLQRRVTYQGHGVRLRDQWVLFW